MLSLLYKILSSVVFLYKDLHTFLIKPCLLCSFCNLYDETPIRILYECGHVKCIWLDLVQCFQNSLPALIPQAAIFETRDSTRNDSIFKKNIAFLNHILLIFKLDVYMPREKQIININNLIAKIQKVKRIEQEISLTNVKKTIAFAEK